MNGMLGSCHSLEIPFVFGSAGQPSLKAIVPSDPGVNELSRRMRDTWLRFAGGDAPDWPAYERERRATMLFGDACSVELAPADRERAFWEEVEEEVVDKVG